MLLNPFEVEEVARMRREEALDQARREALARGDNTGQASGEAPALSRLAARLFRRKSVRRSAKPRMARS